MSIRVSPVPSDSLDACLALRRAVFVDEQGVPEELEIDGWDPECLHVAARDERGRVVGTARLRAVGGKVAKAERVCVDHAWRSHGVGGALMEALENQAVSEGYEEILLAAQANVIPFYTRRGYAKEGDLFVEGGLDHMYMRKRLA
ncbi:MAG: GNAT family N-acetyltransferase [Myxococcota bacterium]